MNQNYSNLFSSLVLFFLNPTCCKMSYLFASIEALVIEARQLGFVSEFGANTRVPPVYLVYHAV